MFPRCVTSQLVLAPFGRASGASGRVRFFSLGSPRGFHLFFSRFFPAAALDCSDDPGFLFRGNPGLPVPHGLCAPGRLRPVWQRCLPLASKRARRALPPRAFFSFFCVCACTCFCFLTPLLLRLIYLLLPRVCQPSPSPPLLLFPHCFSSASFLPFGHSFPGLAFYVLNFFYIARAHWSLLTFSPSPKPSSHLPTPFFSSAPFPRPSSIPFFFVLPQYATAPSRFPKHARFSSFPFFPPSLH